MLVTRGAGGAGCWQNSTMLRIGTIVIGASDVQRAAAFWSQALNYVPSHEESDDDWLVLISADGSGQQIAIDASTTPFEAIPRVHLDLYPDDATGQAEEVERLISIGAERVDWGLYPDDPDFIVLADTEGNRFCVIDTSQGG
jgi:predicted enzyme related to lactoylglutathione lyase